MKNFPFEELNEGDYVVRTFLENVDDTELVWHRDKEDRIVESVDRTNWMLQMDNDVPKIIEGKFFIPKNTYQRVIKGTGDLTVKVKKML